MQVEEMDAEKATLVAYTKVRGSVFRGSGCER